MYLSYLEHSLLKEGLETLSQKISDQLIQGVNPIIRDALLFKLNTIDHLITELEKEVTTDSEEEYFISFDEEDEEDEEDV